MILLRRKGRRLVAIKGRGGAKAGKSEREIQSMLHRDLTEAFPEMEPLRQEYQVGGGRIDTVAFDNDRMAFAVVEYKNAIDDRAITQGLSYRSLLQNGKERAAIMYYKETGRYLDPDDVDWDGTRLIFVAPGFDARQRASANTPIGRETVMELYEMAEYEGGIIGLARVCSHGETHAGRRGAPRRGGRGGPGAGAAGRAARAGAPRGAADPSQLSEVVARCLRPGKQMTLEEIYQAVADAGLGSGHRSKDAVRGVISRMRRKGQIKSVSRGVWQAGRGVPPPAGIAGAVWESLSTGKPRSLAEIYRDVGDAGYGVGEKTWHRVRAVIHIMYKAGKVRNVASGVWQASGPRRGGRGRAGGRRKAGGRAAGRRAGRRRS